MPGNEPPDPLHTLILVLLRSTREALDARAMVTAQSVAEASREACRHVDAAIAALSREERSA
jgi:hypothetical protein